MFTDRQKISPAVEHNSKYVARVQLTQAANNYAIPDQSFSQQLTSTDISPQSDESSLQNWPSAVQTFTTHPTSFPGAFSTASYPPTTAWNSAGVPALNNYASNQSVEDFMSSSFPKFDTLGTEDSRFSYSNSSTDRPQVSRVRSH